MSRRREQATSHSALQQRPNVYVFFTAEPDIHHGSLAALALPPLPPVVREQLTGGNQLGLACVDLLPRSVVHTVGSSHGVAPATRA
jgi:hypothetical protein